jgi:hypothetical protein
MGEGQLMEIARPLKWLGLRWLNLLLELISMAKV